MPTLTEDQFIRDASELDTLLLQHPFGSKDVASDTITYRTIASFCPSLTKGTKTLGVTLHRLDDFKERSQQSL